MASFFTYNTLFSLTIIFLPPIFKLTNANFSEQFPADDHHVDNQMSHLHFYFHDIVSGKHPTAITVAGQKNKFGGTAIVDDPLTEGAEPGSKVVGRAQGMYALSSQDASSLLMVMSMDEATMRRVRSADRTRSRDDLVKSELDRTENSIEGLVHIKKMELNLKNE